MVYTVNNRIPAGDFEESVDDLVSAYVQSQWLINDPAKSINPPTDYSTNVRFCDFDYDGFATYHVKVKEQTTTFDNELIGDGFLGFTTPVLFEITARRLTYGKSFEQLDNIRKEIVRIIGNYSPDQISGIVGMDIESPGDIEPLTAYVNSGPRSIYRAQVIANAYYFKNYF